MVLRNAALLGIRLDATRRSGTVERTIDVEFLWEARRVAWRRRTRQWIVVVAGLSGGRRKWSQATNKLGRHGEPWRSVAGLEQRRLLLVCVSRLRHTARLRIVLGFARGVHSTALGRTLFTPCAMFKWPTASRRS